MCNGQAFFSYSSISVSLSAKHKSAACWQRNHMVTLPDKLILQYRQPCLSMEGGFLDYFALILTLLFNSAPGNYVLGFSWTPWFVWIKNSQRVLNFSVFTLGAMGAFPLFLPSPMASSSKSCSVSSLWMFNIMPVTLGTAISNACFSKKIDLQK